MIIMNAGASIKATNWWSVVWAEGAGRSQAEAYAAALEALKGFVKEQIPQADGLLGVSFSIVDNGAADASAGPAQPYRFTCLISGNPAKVQL